MASICFGIAVPAAADLATPAFALDGGESVECGILNLGRKDLSLVIEVREAR
jgi:hypothetical protein